MMRNHRAQELGVANAGLGSHGDEANDKDDKGRPTIMMFNRGDGNMERIEMSMMSVIGATIIMVI